MKNSNQQFLPVFYFVATVLVSCSYGNYIPATVNEPMLKEAGERQGTLYIGANHVEVQGAYAVSKHIGIMGDIWKGYDRRYSVELMPGYYYANPNGFCAGFYAGGGIANTTGQHDIYHPYFGSANGMEERWINSTKYTSLMFQPGVGYRLKYFEFGVASRVSYVTYSRYYSEHYTWYPNESQPPMLVDSYHNDHLTMLLFQPTFNISAGLEHIKAFFSASLNIPIKDIRYTSVPLHPTFEFYLFSSGLKIDLMKPKKFNKKQNLVF